MIRQFGSVLTSVPVCLALAEIAMLASGNRSAKVSAPSAAQHALGPP